MIEYKKLKISSNFGIRANPFTNEEEFHRGIDFLPDKTLNVYAGFLGTIRLISEGKLEGKFIQIKTNIEKVDFYINIFHLKEVNENIKEKMKVKDNTVLALAGSTGNSTGVHIHYEIGTYNTSSNFVINLMKKIPFYINNGSKKRIFFDPIKLYDYCSKENLLEEENNAVYFQ